MEAENKTPPRSQDSTGDQPAKTQTEIQQSAAEFKFSYPNTHCAHAKKEKKHWLDYVTFGLELLGLIVLCVYAAYTIKIYCANKGSADAAKSAAVTARDTLIVSERPWISIEVIAKGPFAFNPDGSTSQNFSFVVKNVGHSVANSIAIRPQMFSVRVGKDIKDVFDEPIRRQASFCDKVRQEHPDPERLTSMFPGDVNAGDMGVGISKVDVESGTSSIGHGKILFPIVYGCVNYRFSFDDKVHQTRFLYMLSTLPAKSPPPALNGSIGYPVIIGKDSPVITQRYPFGGNNAD